MLMRYISVLLLAFVWFLGCGGQKNKEVEQNEPVEVRALKDAHKVQKTERDLQNQDQSIEDAADGKRPRQPDGGFGLNDTKDVRDEANQDSKDAEKALQDTNQ
jgi:hypothetical protein